MSSADGHHHTSTSLHRASADHHVSTDLHRASADHHASTDLHRASTDHHHVSADHHVNTDLHRASADHHVNTDLHRASADHHHVSADHHYAEDKCEHSKWPFPDGPGRCIKCTGQQRAHSGRAGKKHHTSHRDGSAGSTGGCACSGLQKSARDSEEDVFSFFSLADLKEPPCSNAVMWSEENVLDETNATHLWILHRSIELLEQLDPLCVQIAAFLNFSISADGKEDRPWPLNTIFHDAMVKGLYDADHQNPWYNSASWQSHFYDPVTQISYTSRTLYCNNPTTSIAPQFAANAAKLADIYYLKLVPQQIDFRFVIECFYFLGVALHYFTDMSQPMHAHNYPNYISGTYNGFHSAFEELAQQLVNEYPKSFLVLPSQLTDSNCYKFGSDDEDPSRGTYDWVVAAATKIGVPNYEKALVDSDNVSWSLAPDAQGDHPVPSTNTLAGVYSGSQPLPAGYDNWQEACQSVIENSIRQAIMATTGFLRKMFLDWFPLIMWSDGPGHKQPRPVSWIPELPQDMVCLGCQTVYAYQNNADVALNIYTGKPDEFGYAKVLAGSSVHLPVLGNYGLTIACNTDPMYAADKSEYQQAWTCCDFAAKLVPKLGCTGTALSSFTAQAGSILNESNATSSMP